MILTRYMPVESSFKSRVSFSIDLLWCSTISPRELRITKSPLIVLLIDKNLEVGFG